MRTVFKSDFECVYTVNGVFFEGGVINLEENCVYYITVFPLNAVYLPYTVKTVGNRVYSNKDLCLFVNSARESFLLFCKRYSYVYAPTPFCEENGIVGEFFSYVKQNKADKARALLCRELDKSVSDEALFGFFEKYEYIVKSEDKDKWILATKQGEGDTFTFIIKNGFIEEIEN